MVRRLHGSVSRPVSACAPQTSNLGPLFFLAYLNYLAENVSSKLKLSADDSPVFGIVSDLNVLRNHLSIIQD